jgi:hemerythrin-like domain-containing protein
METASEVGMFIYDALKEDHEVLRRILRRLEETTSGAGNRRMELVEELREEMIAHARSEEKIFYDTLKDTEGTEDLALEGYSEHSTIESLLRELELTDPSHPRWDTKLESLRRHLEHHLEDEEVTVFECARKIITAEEAAMMAEAYVNLKAQIKNGSILQTALETIAHYMPARFSRRIHGPSRQPF